MKLSHRNTEYFNDQDFFLFGGTCKLHVSKLKTENKKWWSYHKWSEKRESWLSHNSWKEKERLVYGATSVPMVNVSELKGMMVYLTKHPEFTGMLTGDGVYDALGVDWDSGSHRLKGSVYYWTNPNTLTFF